LKRRLPCIERQKNAEHPKKLNIARVFIVAPGVGHDTLALRGGLGEANWEFYRLLAATNAVTIFR
jgi:hypothetical protein